MQTIEVLTTQNKRLFYVFNLLTGVFITKRVRLSFEFRIFGSSNLFKISKRYIFTPNDTRWHIPFEILKSFLKLIWSTSVQTLLLHLQHLLSGDYHAPGGSFAHTKDNIFWHIKPLWYLRVSTVFIEEQEGKNEIFSSFGVGFYFGCFAIKSTEFWWNFQQLSGNL